jgi:ParB family chromosome partitioning protein
MSMQPTKTAAVNAKPVPNTSTPTTSATARPRASFAEASFGNLRAAAGEGKGEALRIRLADIDEDPNQPRKTFDQGELESMAESIREHGVVQPIVVRPAVNGRYMLTFGARRFRASKLAGVADIPAVIRAVEAGDFATQVIENQQRANLSNSDLSAAIAKLAANGNTNKQISVICQLKDYQVAAFRQAGNLPPELADRLDHSDMRALYDLYRQWQKTPVDVIAGLPPTETFITITEARRIIGSITGQPTGSIVLDRAKAPTLASQSAIDTRMWPQQDAPQKVQGGSQELSAIQSLAQAPASAPAQVSQPTQAPQDRPESASSPEPNAMTPPFQAPVASGLPVFVVAAGEGQTGRLVVDHRAERPGLALVAYATGVEEVEASKLRIVRIE